MYILLLILLATIPVSVIFSKAWVKWVNAFIPFTNVISYLKIVDFKYKYFITLFVLLASFSLIFYYFIEFDEDFWWFWWWWFIVLCFFLLSIPSSVILWFVLWVILFIIPLIGFIFAWRGDILILYLWVFFMLICLPIFYCKLAYDLALKFWRKPWAAVLYVIFQPIAIWILAFWKWEYQGDYLEDQKNKVLEDKDIK